jgi:hypothetical protein
MPPNTRPGEDPVDIINGTRKRKPSERSILARVEPKKAKATTATGKKKPLVIRAATVGKPEASRKPTKSKSRTFSV